MSAIDTFSYVHVADFFQLPVYWVTEPRGLINLTDNDADSGKVMNQYHLSIGGGSGEHPALIINNDAALLRFLRNVEYIEPPAENASEPNMFDYQMSQLSNSITDKYFDNKNNFENINEEICHWKIDQNQWPLETFVRLDKQFKDLTKSKEYLETKITEAVALFIINEMPLENCIQDPQLIEFAKMVKSNKWTKVFEGNLYEKFVGFTGVLNCQKYGRMRTKNKTVEGYGLNDWFNDNKNV